MKNLFYSKKKIIICVILLCIVVVSGVIFGIHKYSILRKYNNLILSANKDMDTGNYASAIDLFNQSLKFKNDGNVEKSIALAKKLKRMKSFYNKGIKLLDNKKYLEAIEQFKQITDDNKKMYLNAQKKIKESKNKYISENIQLANDALKSNKYDDANNYILCVLKIDTNNSDALKLKNEVVQAQKLQQDKTKALANSSTQQTTDFQKKWLSDQQQWVAQHKNNQTNTSTSNTTQSMVGTTTGDTNGSQNDYKKRLLLIQLESQLQQAQQDLTNAQQERNVRLYENGQWVWTSDQQKVNSAQNRINELQAEINALK